MAVTKVVMPKLSDAMETGKLLKWLKKEGDRVEGGESELGAFGSGVLRKILVAPGAEVPVGSAIAVIAEPDEDISAVLAQTPRVAVGSPAQAREKPAAAPSPPAPVQAGAPREIVAPPAGRVKASPLHR